MPATLKHLTTNVLAFVIYSPLACLSRLVERLGFEVSNIPLSYYRKHSWYTMRTDSRDRFGTPQEQRFTKDEIRKMMESAGLDALRFSEPAPYWCAFGFKQ